jgi:hypothetical protein
MVYFFNLTSNPPSKSTLKRIIWNGLLDVFPNVNCVRTFFAYQITTILSAFLSNIFPRNTTSRTVFMTNMKTDICNTMSPKLRWKKTEKRECFHMTVPVDISALYSVLSIYYLHYNHFVSNWYCIPQCH